MTLGPAEVIHGPILLGVIFNVLLYGIMITQMYIYYSASAKDPSWMKLFVLLVFVCDTVNTVFDIMYIYSSLVVHYNDPIYLTRSNWVSDSNAAMTAIIATLVQVFFARRVKVLTGNIWCFLSILFFAMSGLASGVGTAVIVGIHPLYADLTKSKAIVTIWAVSNVVGDIIITVSLITYLIRKKTGYAATDDMVDRIIRITVQTGLVTSVCSVVTLVCYLSMTVPAVYLTFNFALAKLYSNSLMSSLNSRSRWRAGTHVHSSGRIVRSSSSSKGGVLQVIADRDPANRPDVLVHVERHQMHDWSDTDPKLPGTPDVDNEVHLKQDIEYDHPTMDIESAAGEDHHDQTI